MINTRGGLDLTSVNMLGFATPVHFISPSTNLEELHLQLEWNRKCRYQELTYRDLEVEVSVKRYGSCALIVVNSWRQLPVKFIASVRIHMHVETYQLAASTSLYKRNSTMQYWWASCQQRFHARTYQCASECSSVNWGSGRKFQAPQVFAAATPVFGKPTCDHGFLTGPPPRHASNRWYHQCCLRLGCLGGEALWDALHPSKWRYCHSHEYLKGLGLSKHKCCFLTANHPGRRRSLWMPVSSLWAALCLWTLWRHQ